MKYTYINLAINIFKNLLSLERFLETNCGYKPFVSFWESQLFGKS